MLQTQTLRFTNTFQASWLQGGNGGFESSGDDAFFGTSHMGMDSPDDSIVEDI